MRYSVEFSLFDFPAWSGGKDTKDDIVALGRVDDVECLIEELHAGLDEVTDTDINDFLWFERDFIAKELGFKDYDELMEAAKR